MLFRFWSWAVRILARRACRDEKYRRIVVAVCRTFPVEHLHQLAEGSGRLACGCRAIRGRISVCAAHEALLGVR